MCHAGTVTEWLIAALKSLRKFKLVAWQCGFEYNPGIIKRTFLAAFVPLFDHHLAYHSNAQKYALNHGASIDEITVMHNTVNEKAVQCMKKDAARTVIEKMHPNIVGRILILYVGAILAEKKLELVMDALAKLHDERLVFLIVGDGPHLEKVKQMASGRSDVVFAGRVVEGVGVYFDASDMLILPGTGGLALNEAMAHSLPLISSYADGSADDLVSHGANGFRLKTDDVLELAECIAQMAASKELRERMGLESNRMITEEFSFENFIQRVCDVLDSV
jgi:glycosyltransferase involved in cell wall biosynthesis